MAKQERMPNLVTIEVLLYLSYRVLSSKELTDFLDCESKITAFTWLESHHFINASGNILARGSVYVEAVKALPLPVQVTQYVMPMPELGDDHAR